MAHVGQEGCSSLRHVQGAASGDFEFFIGTAEACVAGPQFIGACRDDVFQFAQVVSQAIFGIAPLLDLGRHADELLVGDFYQYPNLILFMAWREGELVLVGVA